MQPADQALRFAGDVSINKCLITTSNNVSQDITAQVISISIYEDLFSPFMTGSLIVKESFDLVNLFPFVGEEIVEIDISTPTLKNGNIRGIFYIYKLTDRELIGDKNVVYQLHFISMEAVVDLNKKVSKVFTGNPEEIITSVLKDKVNGLETNKRINVEKTARAVKFISNFWSPVKVINYATSLSVNQNGSPNYVFFENRDGFNFTSLDTLYRGNVYADFTYDKYTRDSVNGGDYKNTTQDFRRINEIHIPTGFDYIDRISSGMFASKMVSFDLNRKIYNVKNYNLADNYDKLQHLNPNPLASKNAIFKSNSLLLNYPRDNAVFSGTGDTTNYKNVQQRISLLKLAEANKIEITVPGRADYTVGQKVAVTLNKIEPTSSSDSDSDTVDKMFSGFYLIGAINHYVTRERHECHMELIKDSLQMKISGKK